MGGPDEGYFNRVAYIREAFEQKPGIEYMTPRRGQGIELHKGGGSCHLGIKREDLTRLRFRAK